MKRAGPKYARSRLRGRPEPRRELDSVDLGWDVPQSPRESRIVRRGDTADLIWIDDLARAWTEAKSSRY